MEYVNRMLRKVAPVILTALVIIGLDYVTKEWVRQTIPKYSYIVPIDALGEYFVFHHVDNYGAAFGILQNQGNLFVVIAIVVALAILYYATTLPTNARWLRLLLGLQLGGAIGNVIDRIIQGFVTDFVRMGIPNVYYWPNYNIADSAIVIGVIGLGLYIIMEDVQQQRQDRARERDQDRAKPATSVSSPPAES